MCKQCAVKNKEIGNCLNARNKVCSKRSGNVKTKQNDQQQQKKNSYTQTHKPILPSNNL